MRKVRKIVSLIGFLLLFLVLFPQFAHVFFYETTIFEKLSDIALLSAYTVLPYLLVRTGIRKRKIALELLGWLVFTLVFAMVISKLLY